MFRTACDNSVTTPPPASPPTANPSISKCPPAQPMRTKPDRANPSPHPTTARQRLIATHHHIPAIRTPHPPAAPSRVIPLRHLATLELADLNISARPAARPHTDSPPLTPTRRRSRPAPPTARPP